MSEALDAEQDAAPKMLHEPGKTFDIQIIEKLRPALYTCFQHHGDMLRSIGVFFDYYGALNDTPGIQNGMWLGPQGSVTSPDGIIGSAGACLTMLESIFERAFQVQAQTRENLEVVLTETYKRSQELERLKEEQAKLEAEVESRKEWLRQHPVAE